MCQKFDVMFLGEIFLELNMALMSKCVNSSPGTSGYFHVVLKLWKQLGVVIINDLIDRWLCMPIIANIYIYLP